MPEVACAVAEIMAAVRRLLYRLGHNFRNRLRSSCLAPSQKALPNWGIQSIRVRTEGENPRFARAFARSGRNYGSGPVSFV